MTESATNTNMINKNYIQSMDINKDAVVTQPEAPKTVDMTVKESPINGATDKTTTQTATTEKKLDVYDTPSASYAQKYMSWYNQNINFITTPNDDAYFFGKSVEDPEKTKNAYLRRFQREKLDKTNFLAQIEAKVQKEQEQQIQLTQEKLDNIQIYRYMTSPNGLLRIPIDANGKDIGVPQACIG